MRINLTKRNTRIVKVKRHLSNVEVWLYYKENTYEERIFLVSIIEGGTPRFTGGYGKPHSISQNLAREICQKGRISYTDPEYWY